MMPGTCRDTSRPLEIDSPMERASYEAFRAALIVALSGDLVGFVCDPEWEDWGRDNASGIVFW